MDSLARKHKVGRTLGWLAGGFVVLAAFLVACNGGSGKTAVPTTGDAVCDGLEKAERFRYVFDYRIESPKPEGPVDESAVGEPPFALSPTHDDFLFTVNYDGAFIRPDRLDFELRGRTSPACGRSG